MQVSGSTLLPHPLPSTPMNPTSPAPSLRSSIHFGHTGRVCIVTGGAQGIGEACVRRFSAEGAKPVIVDVDDARGQALAAELGALYVRCDVGDKSQVDALVAQGGFDAVLRVNLKGSFLVGQAVARAMVASGGGAIVNMSSVNGVLTIPNIASYNVSKGGVNQLTRVMALALADRNIRVNAVAPGTIATELAAKAVLTSDEAKHKIMSRTPMKRLGEPSEIADVVAWLASDAASYVTGEIVTVDGGRMTLNYTVPV